MTTDCATEAFKGGVDDCVEGYVGGFCGALFDPFPQKLVVGVGGVGEGQSGVYGG